MLVGIDKASAEASSMVLVWASHMKETSSYKYAL